MNVKILKNNVKLRKMIVNNLVITLNICLICIIYANYFTIQQKQLLQNNAPTHKQ